ncbi:MAG: hypothetical protein ACP5NW_02555 [Candidatus Woesearchaeota archaeon]
MTKQDLEKILMVNLYYVEHSGHYIEHDSPYLGVSTEYAHWKHTYGPYINKSIAKAEQRKLQSKCKDTLESKHFVNINMITIPESEIIQRNGKYYLIDTLKEIQTELLEDTVYGE